MARPSQRAAGLRRRSFQRFSTSGSLNAHCRGSVASLNRSQPTRPGSAAAISGPPARDAMTPRCPSSAMSSAFAPKLK